MYTDQRSECGSIAEDSLDGEHLLSHVTFSGSSDEEGKSGERNHRLPSLVLRNSDSDNDDLEKDSPLVRRVTRHQLLEEPDSQEEVSAEQEMEEEGEEVVDRSVWAVANHSLKSVYRQSKY